MRETSVVVKCQNGETHERAALEESTLKLLEAALDLEEDERAKFAAILEYHRRLVVETRENVPLTPENAVRIAEELGIGEDDSTAAAVTSGGER